MHSPGQMRQWGSLSSLRKDPSVADQKISRETVRRILGFARPYKRQIVVFLVLVVGGSALVVVTPLLLQRLVDDGVVPGDRQVIVTLALVVAGLAFVEAAVGLAQRYLSSRIGEGLIYDLRTQVFSHVQRQPVAFFTRAQTGALVTRINTDVIGAQQAFTSTLSGVVSNVVSLVLVAGAMLALSWPITVAALVLLPVFLLPARYVGRRLSGLTRQSMTLNADLATRSTERFNVAGALLVTLFGRRREEDEQFADRAGQVRDVGVQIAMIGRVFFTALTLVAALATALVYGVGGLLAASGTLTIGTLLALAALLGRLYGPITALANVRVDVMSALVSFERVFEILDLPALVQDPEDPRPVPDGPARRRAARRHLPLPLGRRGLPGVAGDRQRRRPRRQRPGAARRLAARRGRRARRAGRPQSAPARPRSPRWSPGCTTRRPGRSPSAASTSATSRWRTCTTGSGW